MDTVSEIISEIENSVLELEQAKTDSDVYDASWALESVASDLREQAEALLALSDKLANYRNILS